MLPPDLLAFLEAHIGAIRGVTSVGGGCIAQASRLETASGVFFLKYGPEVVARTFPAEAAGLRALQSAKSPLVIPELFGSFDRRFYAAYRAAWPLTPGYPERRELYNLYHLINHLNHFGSSYAPSIKAILDRYQ